MAKEQAERIGRRIRERRVELGLTQRELADLIPSPTVTSDYVSKWERGENKPSDEHMALLATALKTTEVDLLAGPIAERTPKDETPDLSAALNGNGLPELRAQLDRIETALTEIRNDQRKLTADLRVVLLEELDRGRAAMELPTPGQAPASAAPPPHSNRAKRQQATG